MGAMGLHYFPARPPGRHRPTVTSGKRRRHAHGFRTPAVLIYEPEADGSQELVAVENLVFDKAWKAAGHKAPPTFQGVPYDTMIDDPATPLDEAHNFEPHYDRHVWLFRENPNGVFQQFNPTASCAHHTGGGHHPAGQ